MSDISQKIGSLVSVNMLKKFLKRLGYRYHRIRKRLKGKPSEEDYNRKLDQITDLIRLEKSHFLKIYYADEAGINQTPSVPYGWQMKNEPLSFPSSAGQRWNIFGIISCDNDLYFNKTKSSIDSNFVIAAIDEFVQNPKRSPRAVLVIDNAKIHHSNEFMLKIPQWQAEGVEIFYLPVYSPHLNRIEIFWRKIRYEWLLPSDFDSWSTVTQKIEHILENFGTQYTINFNKY